MGESGVLVHCSRTHSGTLKLQRKKHIPHASRQKAWQSLKHSESLFLRVLYDGETAAGSLNSVLPLWET